MTDTPHDLSTPHILQHFDQALSRIHGLAVDMIGLVQQQWELSIEALDEANLDSALQVFTLTTELRAYEDAIYQAVLKLLAQEGPVASDLRMMVSIMKLSVTLNYLADEAVEIAKLVLVLYEPRNGTPKAQLTQDVIRLSRDILNMLTELARVVTEWNAEPAYRLLQQNAVSGAEVQAAVKQQLAFITQDRRQLRPALTTLQAIHSLETSAKHCKNLAEYGVYMIEGKDIRHANEH